MITLEEKLSVIASSAKKVQSDVCKRYFYPEIPNKIYKRALSSYSSDIDTDHIAAFFDTTITGNAKNGMIFTDRGFYDREITSETVYTDYTDIKSYTLQPKFIKSTSDFSGELIITLKNGTEYTSGNCAEVLEAVLDKILPIVKYWENENYSSKEINAEDFGLTEEQLTQCYKIVQSASDALDGISGGFDDLSESKNELIISVLIPTAIKLGNLFHVPVTQEMAQELILSSLNSIADQKSDEVLGNWASLAGNLVHQCNTIGEVTELVGWMSAKQLHQTTLRTSNAEEETYPTDYEYQLRYKFVAFILQQHHIENQSEREKQGKMIIIEYKNYLNALQNKMEELQNSGRQVPRTLKKSYEEMSDELNLFCQENKYDF